MEPRWQCLIPFLPFITPPMFQLFLEHIYLTPPFLLLSSEYSAFAFLLLLHYTTKKTLLLREKKKKKKKKGNIMEFITKIAEKFLDKDKPSGNQEGYSNQGGYGGGDQGGYGGQQPGGYGGGYPQQQQHSGPQVPPPWVARWDGESQRWYYVNEQTGERTWNHPGQGDGYGQPQPSYGGGAPYGGEQSYGQQPSYGYGESRQGDYNQQQQEPKKDHSGAKIAGAAVLGLAGGALGGYAVHEACMSFFSLFTAILLSPHLMFVLICNGD